MIREESEWFAAHLHYVTGQQAAPVLNIGSSTMHFRTVEQPHIETNIFGVLREAGMEIVHIDMKEAAGVDLVGDLKDPAFVQQLCSLKGKTVFCNNLLMHLEEKERTNLIKIIDNVLPKGGFLFLSTSHLFPYTPDPYDSYYRPGIRELQALFPGYKTIDAAIVQGSYTLFKSMVSDPKFGLIVMARIFTPFYKFRTWKFLMGYLPRIFKKYSAVCLLLQKDS